MAFIHKNEDVTRIILGFLTFRGIKLVDDTVKSEKSDVNSFSDMIKNMNKKLGIDNNTTK